eukprot:scaffold248_cov265-Pinguiococcus_pyrenoidosus.AAC.1
MRSAASPQPRPSTSPMLQCLQLTGQGRHVRGELPLRHRGLHKEAGEGRANTGSHRADDARLEALEALGEVVDARAGPLGAHRGEAAALVEADLRRFPVHVGARPDSEAARDLHKHHKAQGSRAHRRRHALLGRRPEKQGGSTPIFRLSCSLRQLQRMPKAAAVEEKA